MIYSIEGYLSNYGFCVKKKSINPLIYDLLKKYFSVKPELNYENEKIPEADKYFDVYYQDDKYIVLPKFTANITISIGKINGKKNIKINEIEYTKISFGVKKFKYLKETANFEFKGKLRDYQELIISEILKKFGLNVTEQIDHELSNKSAKGGLIKLSCGGGKCLGYNTPVLMYDGNVKPVQDICKGDILMGDDSKPRNVLSLARGREQMCEISYNINGYSKKYKVNMSHIISLFNIKTNSIIDIEVSEYLKLNQEQIKVLFGFKKKIKFETKIIPFESYLFGYYINNYIEHNIEDNIIKSYFNSNNLIEFPKIPLEFKANKYDICLDVLAGIIDSTGYIEDNKLIIKTNSYKLFDDIIFILNLLGFENYILSEAQENYIIKLFGNEILLIPTRKKKYNNIIDKITKSYFKTDKYILYNIKISILKEDNYYGFEIDGNRRFLLGDFTVTHNTMLAIYLSWKLGLKTLVVTHKEFLMDQWEKRIQQFTTAKIGRIRQKKVDVEGKDIVIGMLRSLSSRDYPKEILHQFGLVIYDEVHHTGSRVDSQALLKTSAEYTIGLSATPERSDGMTKLINWHVGDILYEMEKKYNYRVLVKKIFFRSNDILFREKTRWFDGRFAPNHTKMIENLTNIKTRNQLVVNFIDVLKGMGRKILILSYRVEHLELLKGLVDAKIKADGEAHIYNSYYYMGKTKRSEKDMAEKDGHVIFATMQLAEEGLDIPHLDTVIFALPVSIQKDKKRGGKIKSSKALIQSIGRILRNDKLDDLTQIPLVVDISDIFSIYSGWSDKRNEIYEKKNWYMQNYYWEDLEYQFKLGQDTKANPLNVMFDDIADEDFIEKNLMLTEEEAKQIELDDKTYDMIDDKTDNSSDKSNKSNKSSKSDGSDKNISKQKNNLENIQEPIKTYGFGRIRY